MSAESKTSARPVKRFRVGFLSILQIIFVVLIFFGANFLSSQHHRPFDLSDDLGFTLSPSTQRYLASDAVAGREEPIQMIVAFRADSPFYDRIRPISEEYARLSNGKIKLRLIDPIRANDQAELIAAEFGLLFNQDMVIIDARSQEERDQADGKKLSPHVHIVKLEDMVAYETDASNQRRVKAFLGEDAVRAGLVGAIEGKPRRMWVLSDKSDLTSEESEGIWPVLSANLVSQNIVPERVQLAGVERIPDEIDAVAIIGAAYDLTPEELPVLEEYWNRPKSALLVTTGTREVPSRLRAFLRKHGVTPRDERVLSKKDGVIRTSVPARFTSGMEFTRDLWEKATLFEGTTKVLEVREGAEDLLNKRIAPYSLVEADMRFWGETKFPADDIEFNPEEDRKGPIPIAAAVLRGNANDDRVAAETSRMIVISNTAFLHPDNARQANFDFMASAANWLVGRESLAGAAPRNIRRHKLPILEPQVAYINRVNLLILPAALLLLGGLTWASRRS
ncbi:hypothetical protein HAHE_43050 [Haloferula helveola]|uniref:DUF7088 domain-containing protein n=1 Tax=Haloferula helveola TaxID=490095 RepID=A0ABM7RK10_9BACT|nr:hypothetical protein HAHE_43050 [Haloferula helveola]